MYGTSCTPPSISVTCYKWYIWKAPFVLGSQPLVSKSAELLLACLRNLLPKSFGALSVSVWVLLQQLVWINQAFGDEENAFWTEKGPLQKSLCFEGVCLSVGRQVEGNLITGEQKTPEHSEKVLSLSSLVHLSVTEFWTEDLAFPRQALYHEPQHSPFCFSYFSNRVPRLCPGRPAILSL
jgi:hypothetical protein